MLIILSVSLLLSCNYSQVLLQSGQINFLRSQRFAQWRWKWCLHLSSITVRSSDVRQMLHKFSEFMTWVEGFMAARTALLEGLAGSGSRPTIVILMLLRCSWKLLRYSSSLSSWASRRISRCLSSSCSRWCRSTASRLCRSSSSRSRLISFSRASNSALKILLFF